MSLFFEEFLLLNSRNHEKTKEFHELRIICSLCSTLIVFQLKALQLRIIYLPVHVCVCACVQVYREANLSIQN